MSHTNVTPNFDLPQFTADDKPDWLVDVNAAFLAIDTGMEATQSEAESASSVAQLAQTTAEGAAETAGQASSDVAELSTDLETLQGTVNTMTALIGNGQPTTTDKTIIGAINEINAVVTPIKVESAANQTYAAQLAELKTTFDTLTENEKIKSKLMIGTAGNIFECSNVNGYYTGTIAIVGNIQQFTFNLAAGTVLQSVINTNGTIAQNDLSANTHANKLILVY